MKNLKWLSVGIALFAGVCVTSCSDDDADNRIQVKADDAPEAKVQANGFWVVNEDWFGHDNGSVNYFKQNSATSYTPSYRVYRAANDGEKLGVSAEFGTVWGDNIYMMSKQGSRLVVADAKTMKKKAALTELGGDGRGFVGISETKAYAGHSKGIAVFDLTSFQITKQIGGVSGEIGMMCCASGRVFAVSSKRLFIINAQTDELEKSIDGEFYTLARSKDGSVWVAGKDGLTCYNPTTLETETIAYPSGASVSGPWFAWNAGGLCASTQENVLYWTTGSSIWTIDKVYKYDIDAKSGSMIYEVGKSEKDVKLAFYGAGLRVDPLTDELILTVKHDGWGDSGSYNWIYKLDNTGAEITHFEVNGDNGTSGSATGGYYWFPALPVFEDANKPQILLNQVMLTPGEKKGIDLKEKVVDYDNTFASMQFEVSEASNATVQLEAGVLKVTAGATEGVSTCKLSVISNGVRVEKDIEIVVQQ